MKYHPNQEPKRKLEPVQNPNTGAYSVPRDIWNCELCNYDEHLCGGCGEALEHGEYVCEQCAKDFGFNG